jgi:hypothetical protein
MLDILEAVGQGKRLRMFRVLHQFDPAVAAPTAPRYK